MTKRAKPDPAVPLPPQQERKVQAVLRGDATARGLTESQRARLDFLRQAAADVMVLDAAMVHEELFRLMKACGRERDLQQRSLAHSIGCTLHEFLSAKADQRAPAQVHDLEAIRAEIRRRGIAQGRIPAEVISASRREEMESIVASGDE